MQRVRKIYRENGASTHFFGFRNSMFPGNLPAVSILSPNKLPNVRVVPCKRSVERIQATIKQALSWSSSIPHEI